MVANIRGGGEFGEEWHKAGNLTKKQNVFDDFAAAAEYLIKEKWTRPEKLAILGGSNGGLLMGAMITQHPDLVRAVVSAVGIYDMLRVELAPNGAFNVTEFGTVKDPEQFKALYAYSPYHHVADGTNYPVDPDDDRRERRPGCALSFAQDDGAAGRSQQVEQPDFAAHQHQLRTWNWHGLKRANQTARGRIFISFRAIGNAAALIHSGRVFARQPPFLWWQACRLQQPTRLPL